MLIPGESCCPNDDDVDDEDDEDDDEDDEDDNALPLRADFLIRGNVDRVEGCTAESAYTILTGFTLARTFSRLTPPS